MVSVYCAEGTWFCSCEGSVTYYKNLNEAMDAAYRQANRDGAVKRGDCHRDNG